MEPTSELSNKLRQRRERMGEKPALQDIANTLPEQEDKMQNVARHIDVQPEVKVKQRRSVFEGNENRNTINHVLPLPRLCKLSDIPGDLPGDLDVIQELESSPMWSPGSLGCLSHSRRASSCSPLGSSTPMGVKLEDSSPVSRMVSVESIGPGVGRKVMAAICEEPSCPGVATPVRKAVSGSPAHFSLMAPPVDSPLVEIECEDPPPLSARKPENEDTRPDTPTSGDAEKSMEAEPMEYAALDYFHSLPSDFVSNISHHVRNHTEEVQCLLSENRQLRKRCEGDDDASQEAGAKALEGTDAPREPEVQLEPPPEATWMQTPESTPEAPDQPEVEDTAREAMDAAAQHCEAVKAEKEELAKKNAELVERLRVAEEKEAAAAAAQEQLVTTELAKKTKLMEEIAELTARLRLAEEAAAEKEASVAVAEAQLVTTATMLAEQKNAEKEELLHELADLAERLRLAEGVAADKEAAEAALREQFVATATELAEQKMAEKEELAKQLAELTERLRVAEEKEAAAAAAQDQLVTTELAKKEKLMEEITELTARLRVAEEREESAAAAKEQLLAISATGLAEKEELMQEFAELSARLRVAEEKEAAAALRQEQLLSTELAEKEKLVEELAELTARLCATQAASMAGSPIPTETKKAADDDAGPVTVWMPRKIAALQVTPVVKPPVVKSASAIPAGGSFSLQSGQTSTGPPSLPAMVLSPATPREALMQAKPRVSAPSIATAARQVYVQPPVQASHPPLVNALRGSPVRRAPSLAGHAVPSGQSPPPNSNWCLEQIASTPPHNSPLQLPSWRAAPPVNRTPVVMLEGQSPPAGDSGEFAKQHRGEVATSQAQISMLSDALQAANEKCRRQEAERWALLHEAMRDLARLPESARSTDQPSTPMTPDSARRAAPWRSTTGCLPDHGRRAVGPVVCRSPSVGRADRRQPLRSSSVGRDTRRPVTPGPCRSPPNRTPSSSPLRSNRSPGRAGPLRAAKSPGPNRPTAPRRSLSTGARFACASRKTRAAGVLDPFADLQDIKSIKVKQSQKGLR